MPRLLSPGGAPRAVLCFCALFLASCTAEAAPGSAQTGAAADTPGAVRSLPRSAAQIPVFPGLQQTGVDTTLDPAGGMQDDWGRPVPLVARRTVAYTLGSAPEAVFDFYRERLGGQEQYDQEDVDAFRRRPGEFTRVIRSRHPHNTAEDDRSGERPVTAAQKQRLLAGRTRDAAGEWLADGSFEWSLRDANGDIVQMVVVIRDEGISGNWAAYTPRTTVEITEARYRPEPED